MGLERNGCMIAWLFALVVVTLAVTEECEEDEEFNDCIPCKETCELYWKNYACKRPCKAGCFCKDGMVKGEDGKCVSPEECKEKQCENNEDYMKCGTACPKTCDNLNVKINCADGCVEGCFCKPTLVRSDDGECVTPEKCPEDVCPENEIPSGCVPRCETCENPGVDCEMFACNIGCQCKEGYYRNVEGQCIPKDQCPPAKGH